MMQAAHFPGFPRRMGVALSAMFERDGLKKHPGKLATIIDVQTHQGLPLEATDAAIFRAADQASRECYAKVSLLQTADAGLDAIRAICGARNVPMPVAETPGEIIARAVDQGWWIRQIRKEHARRFEHIAIRLGFTGLRTGAYLSHESAARQAKRNRDNDKLLASKKLENQNGDSYTLAELSQLGPSNKTIRRGELMTRIRGYEDIASDMGHCGLFATITCPSSFHSVGGTNPNYSGATPRDGQAHLVKTWAQTRAALHRRGIRIYGFRIAEPHTDGCPHWHLLLFVAPAHLEDLRAIITRYALAVDGNEKGAQENRVKLVNIEPGKGTAAGYIAKYVAKNIDGAGVGEHKSRDGYVMAPDLFGTETFSPSQRVTYWSQLHGIRQFQQIGGAPVGVWRELRRVTAETVAHAPEAIKAAWLAVQKIESEDPAVAKKADFAAYVQAQGGVFIGRDASIRIATKEMTVAGRYATRQQEKPCGVYHVSNPNAVYESVRYQWTPVTDGTAKPVAVALPWTRVNNCTGPGKNRLWQQVADLPKQKFFARAVVAASGNDKWAREQDSHQLEIYRIHRKNGQALTRQEHLLALQAKYAE